MLEIETQTQEPDNLDEALELQRASDAARNMVELSSLEATYGEDVEEEEEVPHNHPVRNGIIKAGVGAVVALGVGAGLGAAGGAATAPQPGEISQETTDFTAQSGDGLYTAVDSIPGSNTMRETVKNHIETHPANIDVLKDGLQAGETISIPVNINGADSSEE